MKDEDFLKGLFSQPENDDADDLKRMAEFTKKLMDSFIEVGFDEDQAFELTENIVLTLVGKG